MPRLTLLALLALGLGACAQTARVPTPATQAWVATPAGECGAPEPGTLQAPEAPPRVTSYPIPPRAADSFALRLNIPAFRLDVLDGRRVVREITVAVGTPDHPTPIGEFEVTRAVWNPWWIPPPFEWAKDDKATPPGPDNPTGRVKLFFGYYLFMHGTPDEASLGHSASHGCVRMANADAITLARLVHAHASPGLTPALLDSLEADPDRTRSIALETPVPLAIRYDLIEVRGGWIEVHEDVYDRGSVGPEEALAAIGRAGIEPERVDEAELRAALDDRPPFAIPLAGVLRPDADPPSPDGGVSEADP